MNAHGHRTCPACGWAVTGDERFCPGCGVSLPPDPDASTDSEASDAAGGIEGRLRAALHPDFLVVRKLGSGGMGSVFLAREPRLRRLVAVKVLAPALAADPIQRARFEREAQAVAALSHPNVVAVHSVGELTDGTPYFVMQYVSGRSMAERVQEEGPLSLEEAQHVLGQVASALAAAHKAGVIHRDIKPANILYDEDSGRVLVSDFGIAAIRSSDRTSAATQLTEPGTALGTPRYMSPEQLTAEPVTEKTDTYALGLLAYELLADRGPFEGETPEALIAAHLRDAPRPLSSLRSDVETEFERLVLSCLSKDPEARPAMAEIAGRLEARLGSIVEWPPPGLERLAGQLARVSRWTTAGGLTIALVSFTAVLDESLPTPFVLALVVGVAAFLRSLWWLLRLSSEVRRAVRAGYTWLTVGEVLVDTRGDTGHLISGSREYAELDSTDRWRYRRRRLIAGCGRPVGGLWLGLFPLMGQLLAVFNVAVFIPALLLYWVAGRLDRGEHKQFAKARRRIEQRERDVLVVSRLVPSWYEAFSLTGGATGPALGPKGRDWLAPAVGGVLAVAGIGMMTAILGVAFVVVQARETRPRFANTRAKADRAELLRYLSLPSDSSIQPIDAGRALRSLTPSGQPTSTMFPEQPVRKRLPPPVPMDSTLFFGESLRDALVSDSTWKKVSRGFDVQEVGFLERVARYPGWEEYATVARAPGMDILGSRFVLPFADSATWREMLSLRRDRQIHEQRLMLALYQMSQGRYDDAESTIRETVSFAFRLIDESPDLIDALIAVVVLGQTRPILEQLYVRSGRQADADMLRGRWDSAVFVDSVRLPAQGWEQRDPSYLVLAMDTTELRALRWAVVSNALAYTQCGSVRELLQGLSPSQEQNIELVRRSLVRYPSEDAYFELLVTDLSRLTSSVVRRLEQLEGRRIMSPVAATQLLLARFSGWILRNDRIPACAIHVILSRRWF